MRWSEAHRVAMLKARHAHRDFGVDPTKRVDVFGVIEDAGLLLGFQPLPRMSGAYFAAERAILINANHPLVRQRYTAGHEFGHFVYGHETSVDPETDPLARWGGQTRWPDHEKEAEAFAAWFLMPRPAVLRTLEQLDIKRPERPEDAYAIALRLGTSYQATVRHLPNLRLISDEQMRAWLKTPLSRVKLGLAEDAPPEDLRNDVWQLDKRDNHAGIAVRLGDRLVVELEDTPSTGYVWQPDFRDGVHVVADSFKLPGLQEDSDAYLTIESSDASHIPTEAEGSPHIFVLEVSPEASPREHAIAFKRVRPWTGDVADTFELQLDVLEPRRGISEDQMRVAA
jgi:Zn-dependent peptidase ImmA (M78 family)